MFEIFCKCRELAEIFDNCRNCTENGSDTMVYDSWAIFSFFYQLYIDLLALLIQKKLGTFAIQGARAWALHSFRDIILKGAMVLASLGARSFSFQDSNS